MPRPTYSFRDFEVLVDERRVLRAGEALPVGSRALDVLLALLERGGELVTKEQLLVRAWPGLVVEEANVHTQVSQLRKWLGADAIATVAGLGYRFALPLRQASRAAPPLALPAERTPFVGREAALAEAERSLAATRLLALVGIGGSGKTRLALRLAQRAGGAFADGAAWVDLAPLADARQLAAAVAQAVGCRLDDAADAQAALVPWLRPREVLLVLDNCEHLLDAVAALADTLLAAAPGLKLVVTSREPLGLPGEALLPVRPLELPPVQCDADQAAANEAVRLFVQRALAASPGSSAAALREALPEIVRVCRRVDGIPLAIELAAAQLKVVAPAQLATMLEGHFGALVGPRNALARQQTLQAVIQWSYDHARPEEQLVLAALAVCRGGCDLPAAHALTGHAGPAAARGEAMLLSALSRLADLSLLTVQPRAASARYEILETVRHFALERLQAAGQAAAVRERHAQHYLVLAMLHDEEVMREGTGAATLVRLDAEFDNLMQALAWFERHDEPAALEDALKLVGALRHYWTARGRLRLGLSLTAAVVQRATRAEGPAPASRALLWALISLAQLHRYVGETEAALPWAERGLQVAEALADAEARSICHGLLGAALRGLARFDEAGRHLADSLRLARSSGQPLRVADALHAQAALDMERGRPDAALARMDEVLPLRREQRHGFKLAASLLATTWFAVANDEPRRARALLGEAAALLPAIGSRALDIEAAELGAAAMAAGGEPASAVPVYAAAMTHRLAMGLTEGAQERERRDAHLQQARAAMGDAAFEAAWKAGGSLDHEQTMARLRRWVSGTSDTPA
ncbi:MAG: winged helix-turn-helix domain-containing protein [Rubrivivax sp.]|nr:winged helix-turn-helix domain-containing protein [Rubrivivax sp.]